MSNHDEIPLADDDSDVIIAENGDLTENSEIQDKIATKFGPLQTHKDGGVKIRGIKMASPLPKFLLNRNGALISPDDIQDAEERAKLISQVLELQNTLEELSLRVDCVRGDSDKLRGENAVLAQYIQKLMAASSSFRAVKIKDNSAAKAKADSAGKKMGGSDSAGDQRKTSTSS